MKLHSNPGLAIRRANRQTILRLLSQSGAMRRSQICDATGLTGAGLSRIAGELIEAGLLDEEKVVEQKGSVGRRGLRLSIRPDGAFVIAITITANRFSVGLFNAACESISAVELDTSEAQQPARAMRLLIRTAERLLKKSGVDRKRLIGIGVVVGVPSEGLVEQDGTVSSPFLGWKNVHVAAQFAEAFSLPVKVEPRAVALLRAHMLRRETHAASNVLLINNGLGLGAAASLDGKLLCRDNRSMVQISHLRAPGVDARCACGRCGCMEMCASGAAVVRTLDPNLRLEMTLSHFAPSLSVALKRAADDDETARRAFRSAGLNMAHGIDAAAALLSPDVVVVAGETGRQPDYVGGVRDGLRSLGAAFDETGLQVSDVTSAEASASVALDAFFLSQELDLETLRAA